MAISAFSAEIARVIRPARYTRGNTGLAPIQPIDQAAWLTHPDIAGELLQIPMPRVVRFRKAFTSDGTPLEFDVTADERFLLTLDGQFVSRGPHRGTVENWTYQSYRVTLSAGDHVLEATVWKVGEAAPLAQISHRLGFCLKAEGAYDAQLTTGKADWQVGAVTGLRSIGRSGGVFGVGDGFEMAGTGIYDFKPSQWLKPAVVRGAMGKGNAYGLRQQGWLLFPSQLPDQTEDRVRPGRFVTGGEMKFPFTVSAGETRTILWDLDRYICAYPEAVVKGGKGGRMSWAWTEALRGPSKDPKYKGRLFKGNRDEWEGKTFDGFTDRMVFDGRDRAVFQPPWFRCGRWCRLVIEAGAEPVTVEDLSLIESRYPLACETVFTAPEDPELAGVQRISTRSMQMCCHEMLFDCPYYEQQMYPGDTRVQLNIISSMTADDAIIRRAIEFYDLNRRDDGNVPFNFPTRGTQEGASYTLCHLGMYPDYVMNHANREWLRARLPGMRDALGGFEVYERDGDGLLAGLPGWSFMDWVPRKGWEGGWAPGSRNGGANAELNLFYLASLQGAAVVEDAFGNAHLAAHWRAKAEKLKPAIVRAFFVEERGLFASDADRTVFSEHAQCLALLTDVFTGDRAQALFAKLISEDLCPTSVYFSYYLFETYFKFGRADLFLKRLDMWKGYVKLGATTCLEAPEYPGHDSRSDCHAWGAHPLWFLRTGVAGIRSSAPFFKRVRIAPQPGALKSLRASYPHPSGKMIEVDLKFADGGVAGTVTTPVPGTFAFGGRTRELAPGTNRIEAGR